MDCVCIYRCDRAKTVASLVRGLPSATWLLWALDDADPALGAFTIGAGPGTRVDLLNRLIAMLGPSGTGRYLFIIDDDVEFSPRGLKLLMKTVDKLRLDLAQPAHSPSSNVSWQFTLARGFGVARLTKFVECGPAVLFSPRGRSVLLPFPSHLRMGWGVEASWASLGEEYGLRFGIVDAVRVRHLGSVAGAYGYDAEYALSREELARTGLASFEELQVVRRKWGMFQRLV